MGDSSPEQKNLLVRTSSRVNWHL